MKKEKLYIFILCLLNALIIYGNDLGLNVIMFTIPFLLFILFYFKLNKLIADKKGLLFMIPIIILSSTFFIYDNEFVYLNTLAIPVLYLLMYIYTMKKENTVLSIIIDSFKILLKPISYIGKLFKSIKEEINISLKIKDETKKKIKSLIIISPIVLIILLLLSSADMIFENIFTSFFDLFDGMQIESYVDKIIYAVILFAYITTTMMYLNNYKNEKTEIKQIKIEEYTIKLLLTVLNVIYVIFDIIQINSLMLHRVSQNINYAEYARSGFFQLMFISLINVVIILMSKKSKDTKYNRNMSLVMIGLTLVIIASSFMRMYLYESAYGYTVLRLSVYVILITEVILFIPTIMYILNKKIDILKCYVVIITIVYTFINLFSIDKIITENNINRYYETGKLDIYYLENFYADNIPQLMELYDFVSERDDNTTETGDRTIKYSLENYLFNPRTLIYSGNSNVFEYNMSKEKAFNLINEKKK